ncbi:MAG: 4-hydroxythreonine-4-phosphate dehydrogenase PdxA [Alloprevotella sp.]|nr:4-hydroxythreonine-4-phosphate dehydrogenase PdxA [Alloprevotella sp.]
MDKLPKIGITHGDTNGVGYELIFKLFEQQELFSLLTPVVYGSAKVASYHKKSMSLNLPFQIINDADKAQEGKLNFINCFDEDTKVEYGKLTAEAGQAAYKSLQKATSDLKAGLIDALVTMPVNKGAIQQSGVPFVGHTEYLERELGEGEEHPLMILLNDSMRIALVTTHIPVSRIAESITPELVELKLRRLQYSLRHDFLIPMPRIAVLGLNPHNGDNGVCGSEEETILKPVINKLIEEGKHIYGPFPADGFFGNGLFRQFDAVLAMYHDQGLAPFKALSPEGGVNFTAGLSYVRTSPGHGTAFDIAGKGVADISSAKASLYTAIDILRNREFDTEAYENPLPKLYQVRSDNRERTEKPLN